MTRGSVTAFARPARRPTLAFPSRCRTRAKQRRRRMCCDGCGELVSDPILTPWGLLCAGCQAIAMQELSEQDEAEEKARVEQENHQEA